MTYSTLTLRRTALACGLALAAFGASAADDMFVKKAGAGGATEVAAGNLAKSKGASDKVKDYGTQMVDDHTKAGDELKKIAEGKGMTVPAEPDAPGKKALMGLEGKTGAAFDKAYKAQMIKDHKATIALFEQESKSGKDADLKAFATSTLPTLKHHLDMTKSL